MVNKDDDFKSKLYIFHMFEALVVLTLVENSIWSS